MTEDEVSGMLRGARMTLHRRSDGFYEIFDDEGDQVALFGWCIESDIRNDRGGEIGTAYPLTLDEIDSMIA